MNIIKIKVLSIFFLMTFPVSSKSVDLCIVINGNIKPSEVSVELSNGTQKKTKLDPSGYIISIPTESWREALEIVANEATLSPQNEVRVSVSIPQEPSPRTVVINGCKSLAYDEKDLTGLEQDLRSNAVNVLSKVYCHGKHAFRYFENSSRRSYKKRAAKIWFDSSYELVRLTNGLFQLDVQAESALNDLADNDDERHRIKIMSDEASHIIFKDYNTIDSLISRGKCRLARDIISSLTERLDHLKDTQQINVIHGITSDTLARKAGDVSRVCSGDN